MHNKWRADGFAEGDIIRLSERDNWRLGCDQQSALDGELAIVTRHAGDCFWRYHKLEITPRGIRLLDGGEFSGYTMGTKIMEITGKDYHTIMSGRVLRRSIEDLIDAWVTEEDLTNA